MIRSLYEVGKLMLETGVDLLESLVQEIDVPEGERRFLVYLDVSLDPPRLKVDLAEISPRKLQEVLWVGNAASNDAQDRFTSTNPGYLISQTVPNLLAPDRLPEGSLREQLERFVERCYLDLGEREEVLEPGQSDNQYNRYRRVWNLPLFDIADPDLLSARDWTSIRAFLRDASQGCSGGVDNFLTRDFLQAYVRARGKAKEGVALLEKVFENWVETQISVKKRDIVLYTLRLEGELLAQHPDYRAYLRTRLFGEMFSGASQGVCYVCGQYGPVTANTKSFRLQKYYNTDKIGFASGLDARKGFERTYRLCKECYQALLVGEQFGANQLRTRLGGSTVFVIPAFHLSGGLSLAKLSEWAEYLTARVSASRTLGEWRDFQKRLDRFQKFERLKSGYLIHFLFVRRSQSEVRILKLIADVPPSRLDALDRAARYIENEAATRWGESGQWSLGLDHQFYLFPIRKRGNEPQNQIFLDYLDALLTERKLRLEMLLPFLLETASMHHFERHGAYVHRAPGNADLALTFFLMQSQLLMLYLDHLGMMIRPKGDSLMEIETQILPAPLREQLEWLELTPPQRALYLLGYLVGQAANAQWRVGNSKPVLDKIQFQGMDATKVIRLANEIYEKLRQYRVAQYNEGVFAVMRALLDPVRDQLTHPQENTYWILSGYAFATYQAMRRRPDQEAETSQTDESQTTENLEV